MESRNRKHGKRQEHLKAGHEAVAIGYLERFAADYERESGQISVPHIAEKNGIKISLSSAPLPDECEAPNPAFLLPE